MTRITVTFFVVLVILEVSHGVPDFKLAMDEEADFGSDVGSIANSAVFYANMSATDHAYLRFGILDKNREPASLFSISETTGMLKVRKQIDREVLCDYAGPCLLDFDVAVHSDRTSFSNIASVQVTVLDINDNWPTFPANEVLLDISEGSKVGKVLKITGAVDRDSLAENNIKDYRLTLSENIFSLTSTKNSDGSSVINLRLETSLDREKKSNYIFNIIASDGGSPPKTGNIRVKVTLTDENDNPPMFTNTTYNLNVKEDTPVNFTVLQIKAIDLDTKENGLVRYQFSSLQSAEVKSLFKIDPVSGNISVAGPLRYEAGTTYQLHVLALDGGSPPLKTQTVVNVNILDNGNNAPRVRMNTLSNGETDVMEIPESATMGFFVAFVEVDDSDPGQNGKFQCTSTDTTTFKLEVLAGKGYKVLLNTVLDRETRDSYELIVNCLDHGDPPMSTTATLSLLVTDVNDHAPVFSQPPYHATITENNNIGDFILKVAAIDHDFGKNAEILYSVGSDAKRRFGIGSSSGIVSARDIFDREIDSKITFTVLATDKGNPALVGSAQVTVTVMDMNDNRPTFVRPFYQLEILENEVPGTVISQILADDSDQGTNGEIEYFMAGSEGGLVPFEVLPNGTVKTTKMLDREHENKYTFTALARDKGSKPLINSVDIIVTVLDINDNKPVVLFPTSGNHTVLISSFPDSKSVISKVIAYDEDRGKNSKLRFSIVDGNSADVFEIDDETGEVMVMNNWKLDTDRIYDLTIKVQDAGNPVLFDTTKLRVETVFDNVTMGDNGDDFFEKSDKYIIIAATVAGATCVLSLIIITAICLVLRGERRKLVAQPKQDVVFDNIPAIACDKLPNTVSAVHGERPKETRGRRVGGEPSRSDLPCGKKKENDDIHSDTSGETTTSDSGRGGSEEEVNLQTNIEKKHQWQAPIASNRNSSFDQYYRDSSTGEYVNNKPGQTRFLQANSANNSYKQDQSFNRPKNSGYVSGGRGSSQDNFRDFSNPRTMLLPYNTHTSNMSHDDDASTTTSGSYTISPDEHFHDMVMGKDVIV